MKSNKKSKQEFIIKSKQVFINKFENLEDENRKHKYFLNTLQLKEFDYVNFN